MKTVNELKRVTAKGQNLFNLVRELASNDFRERVPKATQDNIKELGEKLFNYEPLFNEFTNILINQIGKIQISYMMFTNPLAVLKKGVLEYGDTIEDIFIEMPKAYAFEEAPEDGSIFKLNLPKTISAFYRRDYRVYYQSTTTEDNWRAAFRSWGELDTFVAGVFQSMYTAAQNDEFLTMMNIINKYGTDGKLPSIVVKPVVDSESAKDLLVAIRATANKFTFPSTQYNSLGVTNNVTSKNNLVLIVNADADANIDVKALAAAFNLEYSRIDYRKIVIPSFGDTENAPMQNVVAVLMDERFFQVYDCLERFKPIENPAKLTTNWFAHYWRIMFACPWANAVAFTTVAPSVGTVTVSPATSSQKKGTNVQCSAVVTGTGVFNKAVTWSVSGASDTQNTYIDKTSGLLTIGASESGSLTVTATSVADTSKNGTAEYTIT